MGITPHLERQAKISYQRLIPRIEKHFAHQTETPEWQAYKLRLRNNFNNLFQLLHEIYGNQYDFFYHLENIISTATQMWLNRPPELKAMDAIREADPQWFQSNRMIGAMCYVDLFSGNLQGIRERLPYFTELGITFLHLMPLFKSPPGDNDGGYAVSSYREVDPILGTMDELSELATELRYRGISLVLDFVFNHTSDQHDWAKRAMRGEIEYQEYYRMFPDRTLPDEHEKHITPVFPDEHPGSFTYRNRIRKWVWTTFHNYQLDLNYENPAVFNAMAEEMMFLANQGVEVLRLDAVAFIWKKLGTNCENLPQAHTIIRAYNTLLKIVAPGVVFLSEAIVHPDEVIKYIHENECQLSYNPQLMALLWSSLATRDIRLLQFAMEKRFKVPEMCTWVNYIRCHDDIGWAFSDDDAIALNIDPRDHRKFLTEFFTGRFQNSFAKGLPFQTNPNSGDARISGTAASLAGMEQGLALEDATLVDLAIKRILLIYGVIFTIGGIPLIYLGDETGTLNDYNYTNDPEKDGDTRWTHRPLFDWDRAELRQQADSVPGKIYSGLLRLSQIRQQNLAFTRADTEITDTGNFHVFGYFRHHVDHSVYVLANFSELEQSIDAKRLRLLGLRKSLTDIIAGRTVTATQKLTMEPYQMMVFIHAT